MLKVLLLLGFCLPLCAQTPMLTGRVLNSDNEAVFGAVVFIENTQGEILPQNAATDNEGGFALADIAPGEYQLHVQFIGFAPWQQPLHLAQETDYNLGIIRLSEATQSDTLVVRANAGIQFQSPIQMGNGISAKTIIQPSFLEKINSPTNLMDMIGMVSGVQEVVACGVCYTNSIRINGLAGQYTAILLDGTPIYGNLASVYALNGIPTSLIDRVEITKGPASTVFGGEAVGGVVNIITKKPKDQPKLSVDWMGTSDLESFINIGTAHTFGRWSALLGAHYAYAGSFWDDNKDGFGDVIQLDRVAIFNKWELERPHNRRFTLFAKYLYEDRRNGVRDFLKHRAYRHLRGSDSLYGESIYTHRLELLGSYDLPSNEALRWDYSLSGHWQDSYYGNTYYNANQFIIYNNFNYNKYIKGHGINAGLTLRYQYYDDNTAATRHETGNRPSHQWIPGIFVQDAWDISKRTALLYGCRLDAYWMNGDRLRWIPAPRLNLRYKPSDWTTLRLNLGTGFRMVNLFAEDHAFVTGNRQVEIAETLRPERSYNASLNFNQVFALGKAQGMLDFDAYYTYFTNAIQPDYSEPFKIIYRNLRGHAQTMGVNFTGNLQFSVPLVLSLGANVQRVRRTEWDSAGIRHEQAVEFTPDWSLNWTLSYTIRRWGLSLAYSGSVVGTMQLPEVYDLDNQGNPLPVARPTRSRPFSLQTLQLTQEFKKIGFTLFAGIQNLLNYRQPQSPLVGYNDPNAAVGFSPYFDTAYAYSTVAGREFYLGMRWKLR